MMCNRSMEQICFTVFLNCFQVVHVRSDVLTAVMAVATLSATVRFNVININIALFHE